MTNEQILKLMDKLLTEEEVDEDGRTWIEYSGTPQKLIEFAKVMYEQGRQDESELYVDENY